MQELSLNVLDLAQNSISAGATLIEITIEERPAQDALIISIADNGKGMSREDAQKVADPFFTSRTTRKVGLGVPLLKMAAEMTGGSLTVSSELGKGTRIEAVLGLGHIDRMPIGDIAQTMTALIWCNANIDFIFICRGESAQFTADTREFRKLLGEVPLNNPGVIRFIGEFIAENTAEILKN